MNWDEMALVGQVARPHGIRGQVVVNAETDFLEARFYEGAELFVNRQGSTQGVTLSTVRFQAGRPVIGIAGVDTVEDAQRFVSLELRVPREWLVPLPPGTYYRHDLVGCRVETSRGDSIGVVKDVSGSMSTSCLVVASGSDEILIPLASAICTAIDAAQGRIIVDPPDGLLALNARSQ